MSPVGDITIYESQLFRAYGAPTAAVRDFYSKSSVYFAIYHRQSIRRFFIPGCCQSYTAKHYRCTLRYLIHPYARGLQCTVHLYA